VERWTFRGKSGLAVPGNGAFGANWWVRFLRSLTFGFAGDRPNCRSFAVLRMTAPLEATATTKYLYMYVFIAVAVVCCGEVGMRSKTAWVLDERKVRVF
jgi:hypothetical protein